MRKYLIRTPTVLSYLFPDMVWRVKTDEKKLFLSFDDGPSPQITTFVMNELKKRNIKAVFFCVGQNVRHYPEMTQQLIDAGHIIGNHSYNHPNGWQTEKGEYLSNVEECQERIEFYINKPRKLFRPPYGKIGPLQYAALKKDYRFIMWSLMVGDFDFRISREVCYQRTIDHTRPGDILLFHENEQSAAHLFYVLPRYLDYCLENGYEFGLIPECQN